MPALGGRADLTLEGIPAMRARPLFEGAFALSDAVERTDHVVPTDPPVTVRVHRPKQATGPLPCVYWVHGGGYIAGSYEGEDLRFDRWCQDLGCVGVAV